MPNPVSRKGILLPAGARNVRSMKPQDVDRLLANDNLNEALGPGTPLQPTPIDNTGMPRRFYFPPGTNLTPTPSNGRIDFQTLRETSRLYGLLRKCIEIRKNEMTRLPWNIMPRRGTPQEKLSLIRENKLKLRKMEDFFDYPDKERTWAEWLKSIIEDHLVVDAVSIYKRRTLGGKLYSLEQVDGTLIKPILDIRGRRPVPPNVAYQQVILGTPREDFTSDELIYALLTPVVDSPYGFSPVEQNLSLYNLCMRWLQWSTAVFTDGSIPQMMLTAPETWTPDQISELMELRKAIRAGDPRAQRDLEMLPHGVEAIIQNGGQAYLEFSQEIVNYLIDQTCVSMDVTRQELGLDPSNSQGLGGSGRAESQENVQYRRSLLPLSTWLSQSIFNPILKEFGLEDFRWTWPTLADLDPAAHTVLLKERIEAGLITWDDALLELGQEPIGANQYFRINPGEAFLPEDLKKMHAAGGTAEYTSKNEIAIAKAQGDLQLKQQKAQAEMQQDLQESQAQAQQDQSQQDHGQGMEMEQHKQGLSKDSAEHQSDLDGQQAQQQAEQQAQQTMQTNEHSSGLKQQEADAQHQQELQKLQMGQEHEVSQQESQQGADQQGQQQQAVQSQQEMAYQHQLALAQASHGHGLAMEQQQAGANQATAQQAQGHGQAMEQQQAGAGQQMAQQEAGAGQQLAQQQAGSDQALSQQQAAHGQKLEQQEQGHGQALEQQAQGAEQASQQQADGHEQQMMQGQAQGERDQAQAEQGHGQAMEQQRAGADQALEQQQTGADQASQQQDRGHDQKLEQAEQGQGHKERLAEQQAQIGANARDKDNDGEMERMYYGVQLQDYRDGKSQQFEKEMAGSGTAATKPEQKKKISVKKGVEAEFDLLPPSRDQFFLVDSALREVPAPVATFLRERGYRVFVSGGSAEQDGVSMTTNFDPVEKSVTAFHGVRRFGLLNTIGLALDHACGTISASPGFPIRNQLDAHRMFGIHFAGYLSNPALVRHQDSHIAEFMEALLRALQEMHHGQ